MLKKSIFLLFKDIRNYVRQYIINLKARFILFLLTGFILNIVLNLENALRNKKKYTIRYTGAIII
jgi:hypothetical protein